MTVQEFLDVLRPNATLPLVFDTGHEVVPAGYHVTEIKQVEVRSMDCGGRANAWRETVLQVWPPSRPEGEPMAVRKFLSIYDRVAGSLEVDATSHLRVEYGPLGEAAVAYLVEGTAFVDGALRVRLASPAVACKGRDRTVGDLPALARGAAVAATSDSVGEGSAHDGRRGAGLRMVAADGAAGAGACCAPATTALDEPVGACCG